MGLKETFFGAAAGFITLGPIGALLGGILGAVLSGNQESGNQAENVKVHTSEFTYCLLILVAAVIRADKQTTKSEILFIKEYFIKSFGKENAAEMMKILQKLLDQQINTSDVCDQIRLSSDYYFRQELIHLLFKLAAVDGAVDPAEFTAIRDIAAGLSIGQLDFIRLASMFTEFGAGYQREKSSAYANENKLENAYSILGIAADSDKETIKKAFRKLSMEYHPDRVTHLGEEYQKIANEKFLKIKEAYDYLISRTG